MGDKSRVRKSASKDFSNLRSFKITLVGDGMVGKTCLLFTYVHKLFPTEYIPTVFDNYSENLILEGRQYNMCLWDTAGQEDYERLRPLSYPNTNCFIICYSVNSRTSFENIVSKWSPEIQHHCPKVPSLLVGTKTDLRQTQNDCVTHKEGKKMRKKIGAVQYLECSALTNEGLKNIFVEAVRASIRGPRHDRFSCFKCCPSKSSH